jgi:hypothetical protein
MVIRGKILSIELLGQIFARVTFEYDGKQYSIIEFIAVIDLL